MFISTFFYKIHCSAQILTYFYSDFYKKSHKIHYYDSKAFFMTKRHILMIFFNKLHIIFLKKLEILSFFYYNEVASKSSKEDENILFSSFFFLSHNQITRYLPSWFIEIICFYYLINTKNIDKINIFCISAIISWSLVNNLWNSFNNYMK